MLSFFLHRHSQVHAGMPCCFLFYLMMGAIHVRFRCARAGMTVAFQTVFRSCLCVNLFMGSRRFWKSIRLKPLTYALRPLTYPAPGCSDAIAAIKHALDSAR